MIAPVNANSYVAMPDSHSHAICRSRSTTAACSPLGQNDDRIGDSVLTSIVESTTEIAVGVVVVSAAAVTGAVDSVVEGSLTTGADSGATRAGVDPEAIDAADASRLDASASKESPSNVCTMPIAPAKTNAATRKMRIPAVISTHSVRAGALRSEAGCAGVSP